MDIRRGCSRIETPEVWKIESRARKWTGKSSQRVASYVVQCYSKRIAYILRMSVPDDCKVVEDVFTAPMLNIMTISPENLLQMLSTVPSVAAILTTPGSIAMPRATVSFEQIANSYSKVKRKRADIYGGGGYCGV